MVKNLLAKAGDIRDAGSTPESERSPGGQHGTPLQCSCQGQRRLVGYSPWGSQRARKDWNSLAHTHSHLLVLKCDA